MDQMGVSGNSFGANVAVELHKDGCVNVRVQDGASQAVGSTCVDGVIMTDGAKLCRWFDMCIDGVKMTDDDNYASDRPQPHW